AAASLGIFQGKANNPLRPIAGDDRNRLRRRATGADIVLDAGVNILRVFTNHNQIDAAVPAGHTRDGGNRPNVGIEVEVLPERDVDRAVAFAFGRRQRPFERQACALDRLDGVLRQRILLLLDRRQPGDLLVEVEARAGGFEHAQRGSCDLGADPVATDESDLGHVSGRAWGPWSGRRRSRRGCWTVWGWRSPLRART